MKLRGEMRKKSLIPNMLMKKSKKNFWAQKFGTNRKKWLKKSKGPR